VIVELRSVPDCPNLEPVRRELFAALAELGLRVDVREVVGDYPSPSVLVNGADVMGGARDGPACCRLDLPNRERIRTALQQAEAAEPSNTAQPAAATSPVDCCTPHRVAPTAGRPHRAQLLPAGLRRLHQAILRHFATTANPTQPGRPGRGRRCGQLGRRYRAGAP
jgi:hypothetical protein